MCVTTTSCRPHVLRCEPLEDRTAPAAGDLDPTFGDGGTVTVPFDLGGYNLDGADAVAVQPDGRIVLAGITSTEGPGNDFAAVRLMPDGAPDLTFGAGGKATIPFDLAPGGSDAALAIALQPDGKIVLAGYATGENLNRDFAAVRLLTDGALDPSFGAGGKVIVPFDLGANNDDAVHAAALQPDGKIVLAGSAVTAGTIRNLGRTAFPVYFTDFAAARLLADGSLDPTFGTGGKARVPLDLGGDDSEAAHTVTVRPDGAIVLAGSATTAAGPGYGAARLTADGQPDLTFGTGGKIGGPAGSVTEAAIQPDGRIVFAVSVTTSSPAGFPTSTSYAVVRVTGTGEPDPTFGTGGTAPVPIRVQGLAIQPDGKIVLAGREKGDFAAARLLGEDEPEPPPPPPLSPPRPGPVLAGGRPDGTATVLDPAGEAYRPGVTLTFFPGFAGVVRTAAADVTGDGVPDFVGGAGPGGGPRVVVLDGGTSAVVADFFAFEATFTGGVFVAAADLDGDGKAEVVVSPDRGGGPVVAVYSGAKLATEVGDAAQIARFFGIDDPAFRGGARAALGDVNADGRPDLVVAAGPGGGPRVAVFDGQAVAVGSAAPWRLVADFFAFEPGLRSGAFPASGDVDGDGFADLVFGAGPGGAPRVLVVGGKQLLAAGPVRTVDETAGLALASFFAGDPTSRAGVTVTTRPGTGRADVVTGSGPGLRSEVRLYRGATVLGGDPMPDQVLDPFGAVATGGVYVG